MKVDHVLIDGSSELYPEGLRDLEEPPPIFVAGTMVAAPAVAVVGTRRGTRYGTDLARAFGRALSGAGWAVVSGLARGVDAAAHWGALEAGGYAVGVMGSGVDIWYPAENKDLYTSLLSRGGALISEYPPGTRPDRWRFPARNRLIAAMSSATVVVEAGETGGALITARLAAEMGRLVFAVPGDVDRPASVGCNRLIKDGAHPVIGAHDLLEELSVAPGNPPAQDQGVRELLPEEGLDLEDLPGFWGCSPVEALRRVGQLEVDGKVRRSGETVIPT